MAEGGAPAITETRDSKKQALRNEAIGHPLVAAILEAFPGAKVGDLKTPEEIATKVAGDSLAEVSELEQSTQLRNDAEEG